MKILNNRKILIFAFVLILIVGGYFYFKNKNSNEVRYLLTQVKKGSINKIVSSSGYIKSIDSFDVKPNISGKIIYLGADEGDFVQKGQLLVKLDTKEIDNQIKDLERQIKDIELKGENSKLNLEKSNIEYQQILRGDDLRKNYEDALKILNDFFTNFPNTLESVRKIYNGNELGSTNISYYASYYYKDYNDFVDKLDKEYLNLKQNFQNLSLEYSQIKLKINEPNLNFIKNSYDLALNFQSFIKQGFDLLRRLKEDLTLSSAIHEKQPIVDSHFNSLNAYYQSITNYIQTLNPLINNLNSYQDKLVQKEFEIKNLELVLRQNEKKLQDMKDKLEEKKEDLKDYYIYSPISAIVNKLNNKINDYVGSVSVIYSLESSEKIAEVNINEIDIPLIKIGQKAILTFDALPDLKLNGEVIYIHPIAEVSQGVVSYKVKIRIENDSRVKIGMSVNADIITESKENVLIVPKQAIKKLEDKEYIEIPDERENIKDIRKSVVLNYPLKRVFIKTGLRDDQNVEILEGLREGDFIVVRVINNNSQNLRSGQNQGQGLFQRLTPNPRQFIRSSR